MTHFLNSLFPILIAVASLAQATLLPPEVQSKDDAFVKLCIQRSKDEYRAFQATLASLQQRAAAASDFEAAQLYKEAAEATTLSPEFITECLRSNGETVHALRSTVWAREPYRQCISPLGYMCSINGGKWSRSNMRINPASSTPRILEFTNGNTVWVLVDKNLVFQVMLGWSCQVFRPSQASTYASVFNLKSPSSALRAEYKAQAIEDARLVLMKGIGFQCRPLAKKYAAYLEALLPRYAKLGKYDELAQIRSRIASLGVNRRTSSNAPQPDDSLKGVYTQEGHSFHLKVGDHLPLVITNPASFTLKEKNGKTHQMVLKQSTPDAYLHWYDIIPPYPAANKVLVGRAGHFLYMMFYRDEPDYGGKNGYIRFREQ